jgi:hypothetical protein
VLLQCFDVLRARALNSVSKAFVPTADDLNYPERLKIDESKDDAFATFATWFAKNPLVLAVSTIDFAESHRYCRYKPLHSTLMLLSKLYMAVDLRVFAGVAHEAVEACTGALVLLFASIQLSLPFKTGISRFLLRNELRSNVAASKAFYF